MPIGDAGDDAPDAKDDAAKGEKDAAAEDSKDDAKQRTRKLRGIIRDGP